MQTVTMSGSSSISKAGGFMYVNRMNGPLVISSSQFNTYMSLVAGSFLYSAVSTFSLNI